MTVLVDGEDIEALRRDAARFRFLQNLPVVNAQMYFWHYESRKQRAKAIDAAMVAECQRVTDRNPK